MRRKLFFHRSNIEFGEKRKEITERLVTSTKLQPQDRECILQSFHEVRNVCSLNGKWCSKMLTQGEYIDNFSASVLWLFLAGDVVKPRYGYSGIGKNVSKNFSFSPFFFFFFFFWR